MRALAIFKPETLYRFMSQTVYLWQCAGIALISWACYLGLFAVPSDYQQGDAFRIIYAHVPCAFYSMGIYLTMGCSAICFLVWKIKLAEYLCVALAPIGALMTAVALITGSIWGKPMWGTWWIWDARLTSELILLCLYLAYMALYNSFNETKKAQIVCSVLLVIGLVDLPIIHFSVNWWFTLHQGATFITMSGPKIDASMLPPFFVMMLGLLLLVIGAVFARLSAILLQRRSEAAWVKQIGAFA